MTTADAADLDASSVPLRAYQVFSAGPVRQDIDAIHSRHAAAIALGVIYETFIDIARVNHLPAESNGDYTG